MVEYEDAGARRPQVFLAVNIQLHAHHRSGEIAEQPGREIGCLAPRPGQRPDRQARPERPDQRGGRRDRSRVIHGLGGAATNEILDRPIAILGNGAKLAVGVKDPRDADPFEQFKIIAAVRIEIAFGQVCAGFRRQSFGGQHLAFAKTQRADDVAGKLAVLHLILRAQDMLNIKIARSRFDLVDRGRRDDSHRVTLGLMGADDLAGFGIDLAGDMLDVKLFPELAEAFLGHALHELCRPGHQPRKADAAHGVLAHHIGGLDNLLEAHFTALELFLEQRSGRVSGDDRAIEIKQGGNMRPAFGGLDLFQISPHLRQTRLRVFCVML